MFIAALVILSKIWKQPNCPSMDESIKKWDIYYVYYTIYCSGILFSHKKEEKPAICNYMGES